MGELLTKLLQPKKLEDIIGQDILTNNNGVVYKIIKQKFLPSIILFGLPGTGKSSLAQVIGSELNLTVGIFNAAIDKKSVLEKLIADATVTKNYLLIIEEIHRMNKDRQDILLQYLEQGTFTLIACTTENPFFVVNNALRSRCLLLELQPISFDVMVAGLKKIIQENPDLNIRISDAALSLIVMAASGDLRVALNHLSLINNLYPDCEISEEIVKKVVMKTNNWNFKEGNEHHDLKSALQKSIRGSDPNAAIYYLARLLASGDYEALLRRLVIMAYEDIGLANPAVCMRVKVAVDSFREIGMPEGLIPLGLAVVEMALSEKSNSTNQAIQAAYSDILQGHIYNVPAHLKATGFHKKDYKYPPNFKNSYVKQQYLPDQLKNKRYYQPRLDNKYEKKLNEIYHQFVNNKATNNNQN